MSSRIYEMSTDQTGSRMQVDGPAGNIQATLMMIMEAIMTLKERTGSSSVAIGKYVEEKHGGKLPPYFHKQLTVQLKKLVAAGKLTQVKNSFKLLAADKQKLTKVAAKATKPAVKPKASMEVKAKTIAKPNKAAAMPKPKPKGIVIATPKPRGRPPKAAKTSTETSMAKPSKKPAIAAVAKKEKVSAPAKNARTLKKVVAAAPARKSAAKAKK